MRLHTRLLRYLVPCALVAGLLQVVATPAGAATGTTVSLTFDNGAISQYTLGYLQALQPHNANATFYVNSGTVGASGSFMTWSQITALAGAGNDIGGKTVNATNLTTDANPTAQVCNDRSALLAHGLQPATFAYPGGTNNATVQGIVKSCGYGNARTAGGLSPGGAGETLPPANWFATKAYAPSAVTLANLQSLVNGAASRGGGWVQIVIGRVCSSTLDPNNYSSCSTASGHMELGDLNGFLDWMANAGQSGGAPAGAALRTVRAAVSSADAAAPTTTIACNGSPCTNTPYSGVVTVALAATDTGSSVALTTFTVDGTDPTTTSPLYTGPFSVNGSNSSTTVKFRSWDYAGNAEAVNTQVIQAPADTSPPTTSIACNGSTCANSPYIATVSISFAATDTGGSGLSATYYTTDGSAPTTSSNVYTTPFALTGRGTYQIKFFSTDKAGNAEQVQTQQVSVVPVTTRVSLTFDNGTISQYTLGYLQALQPHGANATFFVNSGTIGNSANTMTWAQLTTLANAGNDIGGKTVNATNLTTDPNPAAQICNDRSALVQHGLKPVDFAYPGGAFNASLEAIVKSCGYGNARTAGSLSPAGPRYAETLPPADWYATRAYAPAGQMTLANMEALVTGAAAHNGGWSQIVIGRVCSQAQDPNAYATCTASAGWIELADLNSFLDWMANAGQPNGAPDGAQLSTDRQAAISADTSAPNTAIACNGNPCSGDTYTNTVYVTFSSTDVGSAVGSTHYTLDGSVPTTSSPTYTKPIPVTSTTTVNYRSFDNAGNAENTNTQLINAVLPPDNTPPTTIANCDGTPCGTAGYNGKTVLTLDASDPGGWGVDTTYYTLDGSTPATTSTQYTGPITLDTPGTYTVEFFSTDLAGNAEQIETATILVLPPKVLVSLTFDDGLLTQYRLADKRALKPHHLNGTFYNVSGKNDVDEQHMTWADLTDLNNDGNEIGSHTVDHVSLKGMTDITQETYEVCQDRQNLIDHGFYPTSFAYPTGAYDAQAESIVKSCGFTSGRAAGGIDVAGDGAGPVYSETIPPKDAYALRTTYDAPDIIGGVSNVPPLTLSHLEAAVNGAAQHGGGWIMLVFHDICSQQYDPDNYTFCINDWGPIELATLNQFLDWLNNTGQPGGAPPRTQVETVSQVIDGPDTQNPISTIDCNRSACQSATYNGSVTVSFASTDPGGSGVAGTYYTTDGSTPTTSSPRYTKPFTINQTTVFNYFSVDNSGNVEPVKSTVVTVVPNADPVIGAAGDIACDPDFPAFNNGLGTATDCRASHTVNLLDGVDQVLALGDVQYQCSGPGAYAVSYDPTWGVKKSITHPVPGGEDYLTSGGTDCQATPGAGYYQYFGAAAGDPTQGYYSYNLGQWHIVAVNTAPCEDGNTDWCAAGSQMDQWLRADLANNQSSCTLAYYQDPRWASSASGSGGDATYQQIWQDLYNGGVDVALNGDSHWYERFAQLNANGQIDSTYGVREFIVGTGGAGLDTPGTKVAASQVLNATTHGVIRMTLHNGSYDWAFVPDEGTFSDSGTANCHGKPDHVAPTTTATCNGAPCTNGWYQNTVQVTLSATDNAGGSGVDKTYYTTDGSTPTTSSAVYTGPITVPATGTVRYFSVDLSGNSETPQSQLVQIDSVAPSTIAGCNSLACSGIYTTNVQFSLSATDNASGSGVANIYYTTDGSTPTRSSSVYTAPLTLTTTTTVSFFAVDAAGNTEAVNAVTVLVDTSPPTTSIKCNNASCSTNWYAAGVQVALSASDPGGVAPLNTYYTTDGTTPTTSSTQYSAPFTLAASSTVQFFSVDGAGNTEAVNTQQVRIDPAAPSTVAACNSQACSGIYTSNVQFSLTATDNPGGSGVANTYYTTNGSTPNTSSPVYSTPLNLTSTTTVKFFSIDAAGNAEAVNTVTVTIDNQAPTTTIRCNGSACSTGWYTSGVQVSLTATDPGGATPIKTYYTTNGSTPTTSSTLYSAPFTLNASATVKFFSVDAVGNAETPQSQQIGIDSTPPTTTATCNGQLCSAWYTANVQVTLTSGDGAGSGVGAIYYTTNGSTPTTGSTRYTTAFSVGATTTVKFFAVDNAGNAEAVKTQIVQVDKNAPTTTINCNGGGCNTTFSNSVSVTLTATDSSSGSGVSSTHYTLDGSTPSLSSPTYAGAFSVTSNVTVRFRSWDVAGNVESVKSQSIAVRSDAAPTPVLTVTPASGLPPLAVTADASKSTDTDATGIKSYTYSWGDGATTNNSRNATANHTYQQVGTYTLTLTVTDTASLSASTTATVVVQQNLVTNSGFETNTSGWGTTDTNVSVTRTTGQHHTGGAAAQIQNTSTTARTCTLIDVPGWVSQTAAGSYTATLWVKAPNNGATLTLSLVESSGSTVVGSASTAIQLTTNWQSVTVSYSPKQPGATSLRFAASVSAVAGRAIAFYADDASLVRG